MKFISYPIKKFFQLDAASGILLLCMTLTALILDNSAMSPLYHALLQFSLGTQPLLFWINDGLMGLFFLHVGLELKREFLAGELAAWSKVLLPGMAALGGMLVPACIYMLTNFHHADYLQGWAIPVATDIAFAVGILSLFGRRVPLALTVFLLTLAIFDDVGAILIIAVFHTHTLSWWSIGAALSALLCMGIFRKLNIEKLWPYLIVGWLLWLCVLKSGVHATIAGVLLAWMIPPDAAHRLENFLRPWVAFFIMPIFAFANAGISFAGLSSEVFFNTVTLGIIAGLFLGKQSGVLMFVWILSKLKLAKLPEQVTWLEMYGVALLCGIGFTMSLFLGMVAFAGDSLEYMNAVRLGVLCASLLSGMSGAFVLSIAFKKTTVTRSIS